jgi:hypothetical protein
LKQVKQFKYVKHSDCALFGSVLLKSEKKRRLGRERGV